ncbi:MAG: hypothetical protein GY869_02600, partial [Planctomycetes bacterium]|nr:hypothetical protein [Planctomycetota bacterium]
MKDDWYLKDADGNKIKFFELYAGTWTLCVNPTTEANEFMPYHLNKHVMAPGLCDGIYYDWLQGYMGWLDDPGMPNTSVDIDNDGSADSDAKIDAQWVAGQEELLQNTRDAFAAGLLVTGNGISPNGETYAGLLNGRMVECFEGQLGGYNDAGWHRIMRGVYYQYRDLVTPKLLKLQCCGTKGNYKLMRFALTTALMFDIYYSYTNSGAYAYQSTWWYDEYSVNIKTGKAVKDPDYKGYLGGPLTDAYESGNSSSFLKTYLVNDNDSSVQKVWRRDFENG